MLGGIYTEPFEFTSGAVVRSTSEVTYVLTGDASDQDGFYNNWHLLSEYGTVVRVRGYDAANKRITVNEPLKVSDQDIEGTDLILLSPDVGLSQDKYEAKHLYNDIDAKRLCLALINLIEFGRYTYGFQLLYDGAEYVPTGSAPQVESITVRGKALRITYNKALNVFSRPAASAYTVREGTQDKPISSVAVSRNSVVIYLTNAINPNTQVSVRYIKPSNNPITDREDIEANSFGFRTATNETTAKIDNTPPELLNARITHEQLSLLYDKDLSTRFIPSTSSYIVTEDGRVLDVERVNINGKTVTLIVDPPVRVGTRVYVSCLLYTSPSPRDS